MPDEVELLKRLYDRFNARDMEALLATMHEDVIWANGMEGGYVYGHDGVREYWTRQWAILDPRVEPLDIKPDERGRWVVKVHQVVRDREGNVLVDTIVHHAYTIHDSLIAQMDIE